MNTPAVPAVSVVVPHYGDPANALAVVARLAAQRGIALEVIVADDASPDPMPEAPGVRVVRRAANGGFGAAVNRGAAVATAPLLLVLNSDLEFGDTFVRDLVTAAEAWQPAVAGPALVDPSGAPQWTGRRFPTALQQVVEWCTPLARFRHTAWWHRAVGHDVRAVPGTVTPTDWLVGAALLLPTATFRAAGGFDERFHMNSEEVDLQRRLAEVGVPRVYLGTVEARHEGGGSSASDRRRQWLVTSRVRYARKWGGARAATALRAALALASLGNLAVNLVRQAGGRDLDALAVFHRELSYLRRSAR